jgi:hypothetical protein
MNASTTPSKPPAVKAVGKELRPGDPSTWSPNSFTEWEASEKLRAYLQAWTQQMNEERSLRSLYAKLIFGLVAFEIVGGMALLTLIGAGVLQIDVNLLKVVFTAGLAQVFGLGLLVTRYLFGKPLQHSMDVQKNGRQQQP